MNPSISGRHSAADAAPAQSCSTGQVPVPARFTMLGTTTVYSTAMPAPASSSNAGRLFADDLVRDESAPQQLRLFVLQPEEVGHAPFAEYPHRIPVADYARAFFCE